MSARVFFSYSHKDEALRDQLETHLALLKRQGLIEAWHDRRILAGSELDTAIAAEMEASNIILLLISPDFIASDYCFSQEMARAMERHHSGQANVIPVVLRYCDWQGAPFGKLLAVPTDGKPVMAWPDRDQAFADVARQIRAVVEKFASTSSKVSAPLPRASEAAGAAGPQRPSLPRSGNLGLAKEFSDQDRDEFARETFDYMARYFEGSLQALEERNPGYKGKLERVDSRHFLAVIYKRGKIVARCAIALGGFGMLGSDRSITFSNNPEGGGVNGWLTVEADSQSLFFKSSMPAYNGEQKMHLSSEGAAEHYWSILIGRLQ